MWNSSSNEESSGTEILVMRDRARRAALQTCSSGSPDRRKPLSPAAHPISTGDSLGCVVHQVGITGSSDKIIRASGIVLIQNGSRKRIPMRITSPLINFPAASILPLSLGENRTASCCSTPSGKVTIHARPDSLWFLLCTSTCPLLHSTRETGESRMILTRSSVR